jgi:hypothetical protein
MPTREEEVTCLDPSVPRPDERRMPRLPLDPLEARLRARLHVQPGRRTRSAPNDQRWASLEQLACLCGVEKRTYERWARAGSVPFWRADEIACRLGIHPAELWPEFMACG